MVDEVLLYAIAGGLFGFALAVVIFILFLRRFYWNRPSAILEKSVDDLEKGVLAAAVQDNHVGNSFPKHSFRERLLSSYGTASPNGRTLSMDCIISKTSMKPSHPAAKGPSRQISFPSLARPYPPFPHENTLCERVPEDEPVVEYDHDLPKYDPISSERKNSRIGGAVMRRQSSSTDAPIGTIKPDLYLRKGSLYFQTGEDGTSNSIGKVHLRFRYDFRRSDFMITVVKAEIPPPIQDCYLRMFLTPEDSESANASSGCAHKGYRQSKTRHGSAAFEFDEEFKFPIGFGDLVEKTLVVQAFDCSTMSRAHQQIGEVCLELRKADPSADIEVLADLMKTRVNDNIFGSLEVALSYLASVQRLTVSILQAKGLQLDEDESSAGGTTGVYVRCQLFTIGGKAATKKKKISSVPVVIPREDEPSNVDVTWKEQVTFHLTETGCKSASLKLLVCSKHARGGTEKALGQLNLGSDETSREARQHWRQMLKDKMESSVWHKLQMPTPELCTRKDSTLSARLLLDGD